MTRLACFLLLLCAAVSAVADIEPQNIVDTTEGWFGDVAAVSFTSKTAPVWSERQTYPKELEQQQVCGRVKIAVLVSPEGRLIDKKIFYSQPEGLFEKAAIASISEARFQKLIINGHGAAYDMLIPINFGRETGCVPQGKAYFNFPAPKRKQQE